MKKIILSMVAVAVMSQVALADRNLALLIDVSGSMKNQMQGVKKVTQKLLHKHKGVDVYLFSDKIQKVSENQLQNIKAGGGTNLSLALKELHQHKQPPKAVILITDGVPDNPRKVLQEAAKLKKSKSVICTSYIGGGNRPKVLEKISDVSIVENSLQASLDECLNSAKIKEVLPFSYEEETTTEGLEMIMKNVPAPFAENKKEKKVTTHGKKALIVMMDASGENYSCDEIRKSNINKVIALLSPKRLAEEKTSAIYMGVFSRNSEIVSYASTKAYRGKTDRTKYRKVAKAARKVFEATKAKMHDYYEAIEPDGNKVHYGKDIKGAFETVLKLYNDEGLDAYERVDVVLASDMLQSVNKDKVYTDLKQGGIYFPDNVHITVYGKALSCETKYSQSDKIAYIDDKKVFWKSVLKVNDLRYLTSY